jgi:putative tryptophan/tyrosine transport system substrate-binding protein
MSLGLAVLPVEVVQRNYERAFAALVAARSDALLVAASTHFVADRRQVIDGAAKYRLPAIYEWREHVQDGGLMAYSTSLPSLYIRIADYIDRIFDGARPAEMAVEQPSKFDLFVNLKTAKALGLTLPRSFLMRAELIE